MNTIRQYRIFKFGGVIRDQTDFVGATLEETLRNPTNVPSGTAARVMRMLSCAHHNSRLLTRMDVLLARSLHSSLDELGERLERARFETIFGGSGPTGHAAMAFEAAHGSDLRRQLESLHDEHSRFAEQLGCDARIGRFLESLRAELEGARRLPRDAERGKQLALRNKLRLLRGRYGIPVPAVPELEKAKA